MKIEEQSDSEILKIANPIWDEIVEGCRINDWKKYSQFFLDGDRENIDHKESILKQWKNNPVLVSLTKERQLLGILRREGEVVLAWRLGSTEVSGEFMGTLHLIMSGAEVKVTGVGLH